MASAAATDIPHISVTVNENNFTNDVLKILKVIRSGWTENNLEFKLLTDGITNKLLGCKPKSDDITETVLVRVYGNKTDLLIDRQAETRNIVLLGNVGLAPSLYATFENGLAYQFVPGVTLTRDTVRSPHIYKLVAVRLAKLHKVLADGADAKSPLLWTKLQRFLDLVPDVFTDAKIDQRCRDLIASKRLIQDEIDYLKGILMKLNSPIVFAHNDLLLGNVIYTEDKNCVTFIDYEYAGLNYQAYDIGNHFAEFVGLDNIDYSKFPNKQLQFDWLRTYLQEYRDETVTEADVEKLYVEVNQFCLVSHVFWGVWALIQAEHSYIDFDFVGYAAIRFNEYFARKREFLSLQVGSQDDLIEK